MLLSSLEDDSSFGGVDTVCQNHLKGILKYSSKNFHYHILAFSPANNRKKFGEFFKLSNKINVEIYNVDFKKNSTCRLTPNFILQEITILKCIKVIKPDIIHSHIPNWPVFKYGVNVKLLTLHSWGKIAREDHGLLNNFIHEKILQRLSLIFTDGVISVSKQINNLLTSKKLIINKYLPNPIQNHLPEFSQNKKINDFTILVIGGIIPRKRIFDCIQVLHNVKKVAANAKIIFAGPVNYKSSYFKELSMSLSHMGLSKSVIFTGRLSPKNLIKIIDTCHVGLSLSEDETFGLAPLEMMMRGLPVVCTSVGVMDWDRSFLIKNGANIINIGDTLLAAKLVLKIYRLNKSLKRTVSSLLMKKYSLESYIQSTENIYKKLLALS